jgi:(1->4)-alpha-D-glucan 1-alpha-D-glucosylmutase
VIDVNVLLQQVTAELARPRHATYRLQLGATLGFDAVAELAPYLSELGVSDAYLSPCFKCGPGSTHGYDVTEHNAFNPEIGSAASFDRMAAELAGHGLGLILDVVPNHMGIEGDSNPWWLDVLENGPGSPRAAFFDIDWRPVKRELYDKVLLPVLPEQYGRLLEAQALVVELSEGAFFVRNGAVRLPLSPDTYPQILAHRLDSLVERLGDAHPGLGELQSILSSLEHMPGRGEAEPARIAERLREKDIVKRRLAALVKESEEIREFVDDNVRELNGTPGEPASFDALDRLLLAQSYRLADWRVAGDEVNYRRFFDVSNLAALRMERRDVFDAAHELVLRLVGEGAVTGLRIDHPDGLYAPAEYFRRLQEGAVLATARRLVPGVGEADLDALAAHYRASAAGNPAGATARPLWIAAEKILMPEEPLPEWWTVAGTTGYDFLGSLNGLFVDRQLSRQMTSLYTRFARADAVMADETYGAKRLIMQVSMASEVNQLGHHLDRISEKNRLFRDFTLSTLVRTLREVIAAFPVYRTYVGDDGDEPTPRDVAYIEQAVVQARRRNPTVVNASVFDFVRDVLLLRHPAGADAEERRERRHFAMRFQQTTGPVTAKGVEDTAHYRYNRLVSLNEVGSDPAHYGESAAAFHEKNARRLERWPDAMLATSTHDTKRGEDVRARINVLSEMPQRWAAEVRHWREIARRWKRDVDGRAAPDRNDEYLLYQTLVGAWPARDDDESLEVFTERIRAYMQKATKEAKRHTSWVNPEPAYDEAVLQFVTKLLAPGSPFLEASRPFREAIARCGAVNSLAQTILKMAAPGVPDLYQGSELWDLSLVDPDNRRPVDFARRRELLADLARRAGAAPDASALCRELLLAWPDARIKLYVVHRALTLRRARRQLFGPGAYLPLTAAGPRAQHVVAFARRDADHAAIAAVPRLTAHLSGLGARAPIGGDVWGGTSLSLGDASLAGTYRDRFTGLRLTTTAHAGVPVLAAEDLFAILPVALLEREETVA